MTDSQDSSTITSRHVASLGVVLPLFTIAAARLCWHAGARRAVLRTPHPLGPGGLLSHATATPSVGRPHSDFKDIDTEPLNQQVLETNRLLMPLKTSADASPSLQRNHLKLSIFSGAFQLQYSAVMRSPSRTRLMMTRSHSNHRQK